MHASHTLLRVRLIALALFAVVVVACGSSAETAASVADIPTVAPPTAEPVVATPVPTTGAVSQPATDEAVRDPDPDEAAPATSTAPPASAATATYVAEIWADNWFSLSIDGVLVGEDSVPITTERSFNAETITFEATLPFTVAIEAKDFKETDSGIEYIGAPNQQMGDGGIIAQITNAATGEVVVVTNSAWQTLVVHRAPLNKDCERDPDPDATCLVEIIAAPQDWTAPSFDASSWAAATVWSEAAVSPKQGYDEITWNPAAELVWGSDLETDNTILLRTTVG